jgi:hypothetical protein
MLTKTMIAGLRECADWGASGSDYGMHTAWKPKTMEKLHQLGLVMKVEKCRSAAGFRFTGWRLTEKGETTLKGEIQC